MVVCLLDHGSVHEVLDPAADALAGRVLVNLTTGTPEQARELAPGPRSGAPSTWTAGSWRSRR